MKTMIPRVVRPFPYPLNIGTDICHIPRVYSILDSARAARFVRRVLTDEETAPPHKGRRVSPIAQILQDDARSSRGSRESRGGDDGRAESVSGELADRDSELWKAAVFMAGRFAAKEAAIKAHPHRRLTFHDITIAPRSEAEAGPETEQPRLGSGPPVAIIKAADAEGHDQEAMVSISHDGDYATAVCMGFV